MAIWAALVAGCLAVTVSGTAPSEGASPASRGVAARSEAAPVLPWSTRGTGPGALRRALDDAWWTVAPRPLPGLQLLSAKRVRTRLMELTFRTDLVPGSPAVVRILLPRGYDSSTRRYPTLYLLHGCCNGEDGARHWTDVGRAEQITRSLPAIVVMPDGGPGGMYVDWHADRWRYESYIVRQLLPWVDRHLRTIPSREKRATAGMSMGGFGAMYLASRHPDLFGAQSAYSGIVDVLQPAGASSGFVESLIVASQGSIPGRVFGDLAIDAIVWHNHNPSELAVNLTRNVAPILQYGDPASDPVEQLAALENRSLEASLRAEGIRPDVVRMPLAYHGTGVWNAGLRNTVRLLRTVWGGRGVPHPDGFTYRTGDRRFSVFGYDVALTRPVREFALLAAVRRSGFSLTGSGRAVVRTAPRYRPGARYRVRATDAVRILRADDAGRLRVSLDLGPSATDDQFLGPVDGAERPERTVRVRIASLT